MRVILGDYGRASWFVINLNGITHSLPKLITSDSEQPPLTLFTFLALPYPEYEGHEVKNTEETLFTDKELFIMTDYGHGGRELAWNNFVIPIGKEKYYQG